ncbi:MAG TPA: hypothetical protein VIL74_14435 [Pyrinomonadaceae bacterium]|jgi:hypothetical protein
MNNKTKTINFLSRALAINAFLLVLLAAAAFAQNGNVKTVGIDPEQNTVRLPNNAANPLSVKVENAPAKKAFQARISVNPTGIGISSGFLAIPAGKRLVIENVSVVGRVPDGLKLEVNFYTHMDNDGDGAGSEDIVFHRIPMTDQGVFDGTSISAFNQKMLVFADSQIGAATFGIGAQARLNAAAPAGAFTQVQFTFSGYLEDLPTAP